jgi:chemotaxis protein CheX
MLFGEEELEQIVATVWATMLGIKAEPIGPVDPTGGDSLLTGCVQITGAWEGAVVLTCPAALARDAAAGVFDTSPAEVPAEQVRDLLGELTNVLAGNLKALLPEVSHLGLPAVTDGTGHGPNFLDGQPLLRAGFRSRGQVFALGVLAH